MIIETQDGKTAVLLEKIEAFEAGDRALMAYNGAGKTYYLGKFDNADQAKMALGILENAILTGDTVFTIPHKNDVADMLNYSKQYRTKATSRRRSHGGS